MSLEAYFDPAGVAIVGASRDIHKLGYGVVRNLVDYGFRGAIYPVNPVAREINGHRCYPSIGDVPDPVDLAVVIVHSQSVAEAVAACGARGIRHIIVVSGGFGEVGPAGKDREKDLLAVAREYDLRVLGPNCIGSIDTHTPINTTFVVGMPQVGNIGFLSQSGAMVAAVIDWARGAGVGFSRIVSLGNQVDVNETEMIASMSADARTRVITAYIEGVADGRAFMEAAEAAARHKPVIVLKAGHSESGAQAVASHTGALAGSAAAYDAVFQHSGVLRAHTMETLFDWARGLAWQPLPKGNRIAVLTNAGGPAILAVDALDRHGLTLAPLGQKTRAFLRPRLPEAASANNPVDVLAGSGPGTYAVALDALLSDDTVDAAIVIQAPQDWFLPASLAEVIGEVATVHNKPVLASIMGLASVDEALAILHQRRIPNFAFPERAVSALGAMVRRRQWLNTPEEQPYAYRLKSRQLADAALKKRRYADLVAQYGIAQPPVRLASDADAAVAAAAEIGYPVVLKLVASGVSHKTDVGGVALNLGDAAAVRKAYARIERNLRDRHPGTSLEGVLVQGMLSGGVEMIIGFRRDPQFGPLMMVGSGGVEVELLKDVAMGIAPLTRCGAEQMIDATLAGARLKGYRGQSPCDRPAVLEALLRMSQIAADFPEISELEINPLYVLPEGRGALALDVRGVCS